MEPRPDPPRDEERVFCRRTERHLPVDEHKRCPYCYGQENEIVAGDHAAFCDYRPGIDPVHFGFPGDAARDQRG